MGVSKTWVGTIQRLQYCTLVNSLITSSSSQVKGCWGQLYTSFALVNIIASGQSEEQLHLGHWVRHLTCNNALPPLCNPKKHWTGIYTCDTSNQTR